ncbi:hypothetical protein GUITHDRAFT_96960 [Guillardia theta CCMP2712]|uniref:Uncharacterized protein n=2 Tax=Guillardia theta TaxID=55529 RepID=L1IRJ6_GUITC|nr:hypothetical protein GUITHDRAFT_96960 [Guillardia theta CCMP2712]EKX38450.1 hypothetical protein GUITHDRAFT_96960 [Guillardia theta CCMP2712]|eukprot:XP_005825430.1 hypothetical protein GUITHDRAFT_96960 [Guillardia theta CCMP2712]
MALMTGVDGFFTPASSSLVTPAARFSAPALSTRRPVTVAPTMVDIKVAVNEGEPIESAMRRFKIAVAKSGHLVELKRRRTFETNNEKKIRKDKESRRTRSLMRRSNQQY